MVCQHSTRGLVSSEKHGMALELRAAEGGGDASDVATGTIIVVRCRALSASLTASIRLANSAKVWKFRTCGRLYSENTLLERLAQDCQHVACARGQFIQKEPAVVRPRHVAGHRHLAPPVRTTSERVW
jgi:hypothetical protein